MKNCKFITVTVIAVGLLFCSVSCSRSERSSQPSEEETDILVTLGDTSLTMRDVLLKIPSGLAPQDSVMLFESIVSGWLEKMMLTSLAEEKLDNMAEIEKMVEEYRKSLIIASYRRKLRETYQDNVSKSDIEAYYRAHGKEMILERPAVKGIYIKIPDSAKRLADIKRWMKISTPDALDALERYGLNDVIEYSFFQEEWVDWDALARKIPYRFEDADRFLADNSYFEVSRRGVTYLLHISDTLPSGSEMPYDIAKGIISDRLSSETGEKYETKLMNTLYSRAIKEGKLKFVNYDLMKITGK